MSAKEQLLKLASEYELEAGESYDMEKWQESATLYRLAFDLRSKATADEKPKSLKVTGSQGEVYVVANDGCTCMDYRFRGGPCKHMENFKAGYYDEDGALAHHVVNY